MKLTIVDDDELIEPAKTQVIEPEVIAGKDALTNFHADKLRAFKEKKALIFSKRASNLLDGVLSSMEDEKVCENLRSAQQMDEALELLTKATKIGSSLFGLGKETGASGPSSQTLGVSVLVGWKPPEQRNP